MRNHTVEDTDIGFGSHNSEALSTVNENDILLYVDGRSGLRKTGKPIRWLDNFILENV